MNLPAKHPAYRIYPQTTPPEAPRYRDNPLNFGEIPPNSIFRAFRHQFRRFKSLCGRAALRIRTSLLRNVHFKPLNPYSRRAREPQWAKSPLSSHRPPYFPTRSFRRKSDLPFRKASPFDPSDAQISIMDTAVSFLLLRSARSRELNGFGDMRR